MTDLRTPKGESLDAALPRTAAGRRILAQDYRGNEVYNVTRADILAIEREAHDAAWREAEAALPDGWALSVMQSFVLPRAYLVSAMNRRSNLRLTEGLQDEDGALIEESESLADALRAIAARLAASKEERP